MKIDGTDSILLFKIRQDKQDCQDFFGLHQFPATGPYGLWPGGKKLMKYNPPLVENKTSWLKTP